MNRFILIWMRLNGSMAFTLQLHSDLPQSICLWGIYLSPWWRTGRNASCFFGAGIGNFVRCKLTKHHFTLFLGITASVAAACLIYVCTFKKQLNCCSAFLLLMKPDIYALCFSSFPVFHLSPAESTLQNWICDPAWNDLLTQ